MEPNKLEQQIRDKFEGREIQPSAKSWDRLDAMLTVEEKPKKKSFVWYYIAASLFFVFGLSYWFVDQTPDEIIPQNTIVTTDENTIQKEEIINKDETQNEALDLLKEMKQSENNFLVQNKKESKTKTNEINQAVAEVLNSTNLLVEEPTTNNQQLASQKFISPEQLLASVENSNENISITNSNKTKSTVKVDANSLLYSVESEINEEYRETTFDKLKRKFNQAKTAVANRNYE